MNNNVNITEWHDPKNEQIPKEVQLGSLSIGTCFQFPGDGKLDFESDDPDKENCPVLWRVTRSHNPKEEDRVTIENVNNPKEVNAKDSDRLVIVRPVVIQVKPPEMVDKN